MFFAVSDQFFRKRLGDCCYSTGSASVSSLPTSLVGGSLNKGGSSDWYAASRHYAGFVQQDRARRQYVVQFFESCRSLRVHVGDVRVSRAFGKVFVDFNYVVPEVPPLVTPSRSSDSGTMSRSRAELWARWANRPVGGAALPIGWHCASSTVGRQIGHFGGLLSCRKRRERTLSSPVTFSKPSNALSPQIWAAISLPLTVSLGHPSCLSLISQRRFDPLPISRRWSHSGAICRWLAAVSGSSLVASLDPGFSLSSGFGPSFPLAVQRKQLRQLRVTARAANQLHTQCVILARPGQVMKAWIHSCGVGTRVLFTQFFSRWRRYVLAHHEECQVEGPLASFGAQRSLLHRHLEYRSNCQVFLNSAPVGVKSIRPLSWQTVRAGLSTQRRLSYAIPLITGRRGSLQLATPDPLLFAKLIGVHLKASRRDRPRFLVFLSRLLHQLVFSLNATDGLLGLKVELRGKLARSPRKKKRQLLAGRMPLSTTSSKVFHASSVVRTARGSFGVKVWLLFAPVSALP